MGSAPQPVVKLAKFLSYVLGRRPDELGLVADDKGFVKSKSLIQALNEEPGFRYVRQSHLNELSMTVSPPVIEICDTLIRAVDRSHLPQAVTPTQVPKLLYHCIRQRAYPVVLDKGILPIGGMLRVVLSLTPENALYLGNRLDRQPILLTVQVAACISAGVVFRQYGERLFLAPHIPAGCFSGPPMEREAIQPEKTQKTKEPALLKTPGSFFPDLSQDPRTPASPNRPRREEREWKKDRRKARKDKQRNWA
jgi:putative RNA 2'-phosphotransferase